MSSKPLTTPSLLDLLQLFEQSAQPITDIDGQRLFGVPGWGLSRRTDLSDRELAAWTECIGYAGYYPAPCGDEHVLVEIEEDADPGRYRYRSPETFRVKYIPTETAVVRAVTATKLLNYLADLLNIPLALRRGITAAAIDGVLWHLGKMRIGQIHVDVWLGRGLSTRIDAVFQHFGLAALPNTGIILTTGPAMPAMIQPPRNYRVIPLACVLTPHSETPVVDTDLIRRLLLAAHGEVADRSPAVRFDEFTNTLHITTRVIEPWTITGPKQAAVVKYLVEQFHNERHRVSAGDILVAAHGSRAAASRKRVASIFSGNTQWLDYIVHDDDGYGIKLE
jgi:hypothetical protein